jgi:PAS domain S-box-containing protein
MSRVIDRQIRVSKSKLRKQAVEELKGRTIEPQQLSTKDITSVVHELKVHQIELEIQNEELRRAHTELEESRQRYSDLYDFAPVGYFVFDENGMIIAANLTGANMLDVERSKLTKSLFSTFIKKGDKDRFYLHLRKTISVQRVCICELTLVRKDGTEFYVQLKSQVRKDSKSNTCQLLTSITDVTERTRAKDRQKFIIQILECVNKEVAEGPSFIRHILELIKEFTGFAAIGLRLQKDHDYPYLEVCGFSDHFVEVNNYLCARSKTGEAICDSKGHPVLICICGCVLSRRTDPKLPNFTKNGSFWTNSTTKLQRDLQQNQDIKFLRNQCNKEGYESVALIPLRSNNKIIGLLQINDYRVGCLTTDTIHFFEGIGASLGIALGRMRTEQEIHKINQKLEQRVAERTAELKRSNKELRRQIKERERLETEILGISERERKLLGQQLHDDVGQQYAGTALMLKVLEEKLATALPQEVPFVEKIATQVDHTMDHIRRITRGLFPIDLDKDNFMNTLKELSASTRDLGINCTCLCNKNISLSNTAIAINMYRITQEAITNAIKHGKAKNIQIKVTCNRKQIKLTVQNDGLDFQDALPESKGMGLKIMHYRAGLVKGSLNVCRDVNGGTIMTCVFPNQNGNNIKGNSDLKERGILT